MSEDTTRLKLPFIAAAQAQKHVTHNEALLTLDVLVQASVLDRDNAAPPPSPAEGEAHIVATGATGDWAGHEGEIAAWTDGLWRFHVPSVGWKVWVAAEDALYVHDGTNWVKFEPGITSVNPVPDGKLGINTTADATNRLAVKSDAVLFSHDDVTPGTGGVQFKVNKAAATNTASLLFQDNWSGRAELGLAGDDDFRIKVSPDGTAWRDVLHANASGGGVSFPQGHDLQRHLPASVDVAGGAEWWGPADHMTTCYSYGSGLSLALDRMYFMTFYVPRPLLLIGCFVSLYTASTTTGAVLRTGVYELGGPAGDSWNIGSLVADFGTLPADAADNKVFDLATPLPLQPGWYVTALGVNGSDAAAIYGRWFVPGTQRVFPDSGGTSARPRLAGHSLYFYEGNSGDEISNGLPATWSRNPVADVVSANAWTYQMVFPKWRLP